MIEFKDITENTERGTIILPDADKTHINFWDVTSEDEQRRTYEFKHIAAGTLTVTLFKDSGEVVIKTPKAFLDLTEVDSFTVVYTHAVKHATDLKRAHREKVDEARRRWLAERKEAGVVAKRPVGVAPNGRTGK